MKHSLDAWTSPITGLGQVAGECHPPAQAPPTHLPPGTSVLPIKASLCLPPFSLRSPQISPRGQLLVPTAATSPDTVVGGDRGTHVGHRGLLPTQPPVSGSQASLLSPCLPPPGSRGTTLTSHLALLQATLAPMLLHTLPFFRSQLTMPSPPRAPFLLPGLCHSHSSAPSHMETTASQGLKSPGPQAHQDRQPGNSPSCPTHCDLKQYWATSNLTPHLNPDPSPRP